VVSLMTLVLTPVNKNYLTNYEVFVCCDEVQFHYFCENHFAKMGCSLCTFDPSTSCEEQH